MNDISPQRIETTWNLSECMTKALPRETIERVVAMSHAAVETQWVRDWIKMGFEPLDEKGTCTLHSPVIAMCQTGKFKVCTVYMQYFFSPIIYEAKTSANRHLVNSGAKPKRLHHIRT